MSVPNQANAADARPRPSCTRKLNFDSLSASNGGDENRNSVALSSPSGVSSAQQRHPQIFRNDDIGALSEQYHYDFANDRPMSGDGPYVWSCGEAPEFYSREPYRKGDSLIPPQAVFDRHNSLTPSAHPDIKSEKNEQSIEYCLNNLTTPAKRSSNKSDDDDLV